MKMNWKYTLILFPFLSLMTGCSSKSEKKQQQLVGNSKDDHGCLTSAGYCWSEAKKDCIRIWEVGTKVVAGEKHLFVVFAPDSVQAEIFAGSGKKLLCTKQAEKMIWVPSEGKEEISLSEKGLQVLFDGETYQTQEK